MPKRQPTPLLNLPYDILSLILHHLIPYGIHIFLHSGRLHTSPCLGSDDPKLNLTSHERYTAPRQDGIDVPWSGEHPPWARRLMSSWGEHWRCEEMMLNEIGEEGIESGGCENIFALLRTCRNVRENVSDYISQDVNIVITDLRTLDVLLRADEPVMGFKMASVRRLEIMAILPLDVITAIEIKSTASSHNLPHDSNIVPIPQGWSVHDLPKDAACRNTAMAQAKMWLALSATFKTLQKLRNCRLILDLAGPEFWWEINESALLSPFIPLAPRPNMTFTVHLPSHAVDDVPLPAPFDSPNNIHRFPRRWHFSQTTTTGNLKVVLKRQFPLNVAFEEFISIDADFGSLEPTAGQQKAFEDFMERLVETERKEWRDGVDVIKYVNAEMDIWSPCGLGPI